MGGPPKLLLGGVGGGAGDPSGLAIRFLAGNGGGIGGNDEANDSGLGGSAGTLRPLLDRIAEWGRPDV